MPRLSKRDFGQLYMWYEGETYQDCSTDILLLNMCLFRPSKHDLGPLWDYRTDVQMLSAYMSTPSKRDIGPL